MAEIYMRLYDDCFEEMKAYKLSTTPEEFCSDPRTSCLIEILKEAYSYEYEDTPRYGVMKFMLQKELMALNCIPDKYFSWFHKGFIGRPISSLGYIKLQSAGID